MTQSHEAPFPRRHCPTIGPTIMTIKRLGNEFEKKSNRTAIYKSIKGLNLASMKATHTYELPLETISTNQSKASSLFLLPSRKSFVHRTLL